MHFIKLFFSVAAHSLVNANISSSLRGTTYDDFPIPTVCAHL